MKGETSLIFTGDIGFDKYMDKKYCPVYAKESLSRAYAAYHTLGGNDVATELYHQVIELPVGPPDENAE